ncbi:mannose-6-phosphate isomerase-like isoform X1 [Rhagoletis pomonella]|uniref:mannose-6-phosphate isomerase-like isoform X1 n=1 Tax=Rhagoletis pomonella TaxID=28610 RepID=UPI00177CBB9D|nr:mannose-6-phosphate isomerase-like isoform X1 [Rhagoletis pomonella]
MELIGFVHKYEWGKLGNDSAVAQLATLNDPQFKVDLKSTYAELWMGSHPNGPSRYKSDGSKLEEELPFLLKVLSINKALSIQVHPNKEEARRLHTSKPEIYKDPNHKPEMAIALTPFVGLCGFRPLPQIRDILLRIHPLNKLTVDDPKDLDLLAKDDEQGLRHCYEKLLNQSAIEIGLCIDSISKEYSKVLCDYNIIELYNKLKEDFPNDVGVLSIFFLNVIRLQPGQAMFLGANQIHAYLSGDVVECMACSDNVIRAGLTPKYKDINQLLSCLEYTGSPAQNKIFAPERIDDQRLLFKPPVEDFALTQLTLGRNDTEYVLKVEQSPGILLVISGQRTLESIGNNALKLKRGSIVYLPWKIGTEMRFISSGEDNTKFLTYISTPNSP